MRFIDSNKIIYCSNFALLYKMNIFTRYTYSCMTTVQSTLSVHGCPNRVVAQLRLNTFLFKAKSIYFISIAVIVLVVKTCFSRNKQMSQQSYWTVVSDQSIPNCFVSGKIASDTDSNLSLGRLQGSKYIPGMSQLKSLQQCFYLYEKTVIV